jgi:hypothetical protein
MTLRNAIGDIHGMLEPLREVEGKISRHAAKRGDLISAAELRPLRPTSQLAHWPVSHRHLDQHSRYKTHTRICSGLFETSANLCRKRFNHLHSKSAGRICGDTIDETDAVILNT